MGTTEAATADHRRWRRGLGLLAAFIAAYLLPVGQPRFDGAVADLTARILGWELGLAPTIGAVVFSVVIVLASAICRSTSAPLTAYPAWASGGWRRP